MAVIDPTVTVAVAAAALGPIGAYFIAAKRMSGRISNSDAEQLWAESRAIREWSTQRIEADEAKIVELQVALEALKERCSVLEDRNRELMDELNDSRNRISELVELVSSKRKGTLGESKER